MKPFLTELSMALRGKLGTPWKLWLGKKIINKAAALVRRAIPKHQRVGYGVAMWWYQLEEMKKLHRAELEADDSQRARDHNFLNLLDLIQELGCYIGTCDPYYRLWISYFFRQASSTWFLAAEEYKGKLQATFAQLPPEQVERYNNPEFMEKAFNLKTCGGLYELEQVMKDAS